MTPHVCDTFADGTRKEKHMIAIFIAIGSALATYYGLQAWEIFTRCPARFSREWYQQEFNRIATDLTVISPEL
ncbi:MAG: hypothetical protein ACN4GK_10735 [Acidimicrobiia bacterium]